MPEALARDPLAVEASEKTGPVVDESRPHRSRRERVPRLSRLRASESSGGLVLSRDEECGLERARREAERLAEEDPAAYLDVCRSLSRR
jgi:hypothetical protein